MRRAVVWVVLLLVVVLAGLGVYWIYSVTSGLEARIARLEETVSAHSEVLKALGERVSSLEQKVTQQGAPPLALPAPPSPGQRGTGFWTFLGGLALILLALYLLLLLLRRKKETPPPKDGASAPVGGASSSVPPGEEKGGDEGR